MKFQAFTAPGAFFKLGGLVRVYHFTPSPQDGPDSDHKEVNWLCCQFCISRPHSFGHTHFCGSLHMKMRVVENFGQLSNVMNKNMG